MSGWPPAFPFHLPPRMDTYTCTYSSACTILEYTVYQSQLQPSTIPTARRNAATAATYFSQSDQFSQKSSLISINKYVVGLFLDILVCHNPSTVRLKFQLTFCRILWYSQQNVVLMFPGPQLASKPVACYCIILYKLPIHGDVNLLQFLPYRYCRP